MVDLRLTLLDQVEGTARLKPFNLLFIVRMIGQDLMLATILVMEN